MIFLNKETIFHLGSLTRTQIIIPRDINFKTKEYIKDLMGGGTEATFFFFF